MPQLLLGAPTEADAGKVRSETEVMNLLIKITRMFNATADTRSRVLAAMLKLTSRFTTPIEQARIRFVRAVLCRAVLVLGMMMVLCRCSRASTLPLIWSYSSAALSSLALLSCWRRKSAQSLWSACLSSTQR